MLNKVELELQKFQLRAFKRLQRKRWMNTIYGITFIVIAIKELGQWN